MLDSIENKKNFEYALESIIGMMDLMKRHQELIAELKRSFYNECLKQGFTEEQALELTARHNPMVAQ